MILRAGMAEGEKTVDHGSSFRLSLSILPAGRRTERKIRELSGLFRPLGMGLRKGTGAAVDGVSLHAQLITGNSRPVGISQLN